MRLPLRRWLGRELQDCRALTFGQERQQYRLSVGELESIVVVERLIEIDLPEDSRLVNGGIKRGYRLDVAVERELRTRHYTNRRSCVAFSGEAAGPSTKIVRTKSFANNGRARFNMHETIVAHGSPPISL
jgi:hypothetical protein